MSVDPTLLQVIAAWSEGGYWATAVDARWRLVAVTAELAAVADDQFAMGEFFYGPEQTAAELKGRSGHNSLEEKRADFLRHGAWLLADIPGGRDALRDTVDPAVRDLVDEIGPRADEAITYDARTEAFGTGAGATMVCQRVRDPSGRVVGTVLVTKPAVGMNTIGMLAGAGDLGHFARMRQLAGRSEVTALGDEVNEAARIEACASGGRLLASKELVERLNADDATALAIDPGRVMYTQLGDLDSATEKARRDAPAIAVCDLAGATA
jgi:hypothetical protein